MAEYLTVTEVPGNKASREQIERLFHRYHFASTFCQGKDVLEVACGAGMGLGYLEQVANRVVGGDIDEEILIYARGHYQGRNKIEIRQLDAQQLPFGDKSFDVVLFYEAIYYLAQPEKFIEEAHRVLRSKGVLIICSANKEWADFNPSPFGQKYFSAPEMFQLLGQKFSDIQIYGAFFAKEDSMKAKMISLIKRAAIKLHLMPRTMKGKQLFKRLFFGRLAPLPAEIEKGLAEYIPPLAISKESRNPQYRVLYAVAWK
jgi:ubiquinone/menaquinone biosynthesis C-methylase UbiE